MAKKVFTYFFHLFTPFKRLLAPTSKLSKFFRFSESLGKTNGKRWSQKGCKIAAQKSLIFNKFCLTSRNFLYWCYYPHRSRDALSPVSGIFLPYCHHFWTTMELFWQYFAVLLQFFGLLEQYFGVLWRYLNSFGTSLEFINLFNGTICMNLSIL